MEKLRIMEAHGKEAISVGSRIIKLRESLGLNQNKFAKLIGFNQAYLSYIESGKKEPSYKLIHGLIENYDIVKRVNFNWLLIGLGDMLTPVNTSTSSLDTTLPPEPSDDIAMFAKATNDKLAEQGQNMHQSDIELLAISTSGRFKHLDKRASVLDNELQVFEKRLARLSSLIYKIKNDHYEELQQREREITDLEDLCNYREKQRQEQIKELNEVNRSLENRIAELERKQRGRKTIFQRIFKKQ